MPIYEYQCAKCKKVHEIWQKITEPNATKCPTCGGKIERLISASGFALKGTGWYKTDYERKGKSGGSETKSESESSSSSSSTSSSDSSGGDDPKPKAKSDGDKKKKKDAGGSEKKKESGGGGSDKKAQAA
jgi:putative FmdB family regulatory protein